MSWFKRISLAFLIILLLLLGGIAFLLGTQTGLHLLINSAQRWVPGLNIASVDGGWRNLTLKGVQYQMPGVAVKAGEFHLALDTSCLWHSKVCVNALRLQDVDVAVKTQEMTPSEPETAPTSSEPLNLSTPYPIDLRLTNP